MTTLTVVTLAILFVAFSPATAVNLCAGVTCKSGEVCFEKDVVCIKAPCPPVPTCIKDPCLDLICNAASTCEIDGNGKAYCLPLPGNPGNPTTQKPNRKPTRKPTRKATPKPTRKGTPKPTRKATPRPPIKI